MSAGETGAAPPDVSVVTIFHNEARHLADAVDSVLDQAGPRWELVLVDDGSSDDSTAIARSFAADQPDRIRYTAHPGHTNRGMSASRNLGLAEARGRWLTFLDADDVWLPGKLEAQLSALERHPDVEVLVSPAQWWRTGPGGDPSATDWVQTLGHDVDGEAVVDPPELVIDFLEDEWRSICDLVILRERAVAVGGYEERFRDMFEDQVFHAKVLSRCPALVTSDWWYRYRQHPEACTASSHREGSHRAARRRYLEWLAGRLREGSSPELERVVRAHLRRARHPHLTRALRRLSPAVGGP
jgi:glycosyltransferase involved in cell wall biosynthesis